MKNRIEALLDKLQLSPSKFADELGMQRSAMSHILSGRNKPSLEVMQKILNRFPEVNIDWLIQGKGSIFNDGKSVTVTQNQDITDTRLYDVPQTIPVKEELSETTIDSIIEQPIISKAQTISKLEPRPQLALFDMPPITPSATTIIKESAVKVNKIIKPTEEPESSSEAKLEKSNEKTVEEKTVKSIVVFYSDNTFSAFKPGESFF